eukprot:TRINITY_DN37363_c0_g1_i1.p2 TRINITY_DN37363_c0_g1~~TRINITY_DN37363_c0_g1_i1.p2  ORF type:complete len:342 (+),score=65.08 TRINITY_DN37363_c0_g1_i1:71-1027(+)
MPAQAPAVQRRSRKAVDLLLSARQHLPGAHPPGLSALAAAAGGPSPRAAATPPRVPPALSAPGGAASPSSKPPQTAGGAAATPQQKQRAHAGSVVRMPSGSTGGGSFMQGNRTGLSSFGADVTCSEPSTAPPSTQGSPRGPLMYGHALDSQPPSPAQAALGCGASELTRASSMASFCLADAEGIDRPTRMLRNLDVRTTKMGRTLAQVTGEMGHYLATLGAVQTQHLRLYHEAFGGYTTSLREVLAAMNVLTAQLDTMDRQLQGVPDLQQEVGEVLEAAQLLDKTVAQIERQREKDGAAGRGRSRGPSTARRSSTPQK